MKPPRRPLRSVCLALTLALAWGKAESADRVALAIGVDQYDKLGRSNQLNVAVADARRIKNTLEGLAEPFEVTLVENADYDEMADEIAEFVDRAEFAECALVYFAGHGIEYHGVNFLLPRDIDVSDFGEAVERTKRSLSRRSINLQHLLDDVEATKAGVKVVILDACRDNPLEVRESGASGTRTIGTSGGGLASVNPPMGMLISYSANAGEKANDGLFTEILCRNLQAPGATIMRVFAKTRQEVAYQSRLLAESEPGAVIHTPGEYSMLTEQGLAFSFTGGAAGSSSQWDSDRERELEILRRQREEDRRRMEELERQVRNGRMQPDVERPYGQPDPPVRRQPRSFTVGSDSVGMSLQPGGTFTATLYEQSVSLFEEDDVDESIKAGVPWVRGGMVGWMAIRKPSRSYDYARSNGDGTLTITWDGGGDPSDAYISLRPNYGLKGNRLAKMWTGSQVEVIDANRVSSSGFYWIKVRLIGWVPRKSPNGYSLLREK
ncbi:MAG: caspase family protein [Verrucomicrobiota bacterium]